MFAAWLAALEARHLADLRVPEVTRALRALSSAYVERRHRIGAGAALDTAGKRAAFALFYGPLHFLTVRLALDALGAATPRLIHDLGCGTGAAGAAWATHGTATARIRGVDRHHWAVDESRWTYRQFGLDGAARTGDLARLPPADSSAGFLAAYVLNELPDAPRARVEAALVRAATSGSPVLVLEPVSRRVAPWWDDAAALIASAGGRADEWRFRAELPPLVRLLDRAAGLDHSVLTVRTLSINLRPAARGRPVVEPPGRPSR
jgi:hypothetical protein